MLCFLALSIFISCEDDEGVTENMQKPRVNFEYSPTTPKEGEEVAFTAATDDGSTEIISWNWHFGDADSTTSTEQNPTFSYKVLGDYEVTLEVTDAFQNVFRTHQGITVADNEYIAWTFSTNTNVANINDGSSAPVIGDDGTIYYTESRAGVESKVVAVIDKGDSAEIKWTSSAMGGDLPNSPSIGKDGGIFINAWVDDYAISKLNASDGSVVWSGGIGTDVSNNTVAVDSEGNAYHGSRSQGENGGVYSWSPEGEKRWEITGVGAFYSAPAISADESTVYFFNSSTGEIWAVNTADGALKWDNPVGIESAIHGTSLSIDADGTVYYTTNTHVVAISDEGSTGAVKWSLEVGDASNSGIVIGHDGTLYTGSAAGLLSINPAGTLNWSYDAQIIESVPAVDALGRIYVGTSDGRLIIVNADGALAKEFQLGDGVANSPTIADDGAVYIEVLHDDTIKLCKIIGESTPADSPWPMKGQNAKNTGKAI